MSLSDILNNIPQMIWNVKVDQGIVTTLYTNRHWDDYTGCATSICTPNDTLYDAFLKNKAFTLKRRIKRHDGVYRWFLTRANVYDNLWYGSCTDIADLNTLEESLNTLTNNADIAEQTRIELAEHVADEKDSAESKRILLANEKSIAEQTRLTVASEKELAEKTRLVLAEHAEILAINVLEKEFEKQVAEKTRIDLSKKAQVLAKEVLQKEKIRLALLDHAKMLANEAIDKELEKDLAEEVRITLSENAKILAINVLEKEFEKQVAEKTRIDLSKQAQVLAKEVLQKEKIRLALLDHAQMLANEAIDKELEKDIAEQVRMTLSENAKLLAIDVLEKEFEKEAAEKTRIDLSKKAQVLAKEVLQKEKIRLALLDHAKMLAIEAIDKELEKDIAEQVRITLSENAKILADDVTLAEKTRVLLSKQVAEEVIITNKAMKQLQQDKLESMTEMTHEIRSPLNGVLGIIELMSGIEMRPEILEYVVILKEATSTLLNAVNDTLDIAKMNSGKMLIESISFSPKQLLSDIYNLYSPLVQAKGVQLYQKINKDVLIKGDPHRTKQILYNLLSNAVKFTKNGSITVQAEITTDFIIYSVIDTGIGISQHNLSKLFQPYVQADSSTSRRFGGSGLGLSICKKLVDLMNGEILVKSTISSGSTFSVKIPITLNT